MNDFLQSIGYGNWILPALLIIPVIGALVIWALGARATTPAEGDADDVTSGRANGPRNIALITFLVEFVVSLGLWWSVVPAGALFQHFGFTPDNVADTVRAVLQKQEE